MEDLAGLGKIATAILDKVAAVTGTLYEPTRVRRLGRAEADVKAELILKTTAAELEAEDMRRQHKAELKTIDHDPELLRERAGQRLIRQEIKRQRNLEVIVYDALDDAGDGDPRPIEDDWMEAFIQYAQDISSDGVRQLWSRILSSQAADGRPAVSKATLDALRLLEPHQAANLRRALQLHIAMGQIMDVDPHGDSEIAFNVNALESLALEDIGFLKRLQEKEAGIGLANCTLSFWEPYAQVSEDDRNKTAWNTKEYFRKMIPRIKHVSAGHYDVDGLRKQTPIDRYILTSRGYELGSILIDGFYDLMHADESPHDPGLGRYADADVRAGVLAFWAEQFSEKGAVVILNRSQRNQNGRSETVPERLFDAEKREWIDISEL